MVNEQYEGTLNIFCMNTLYSFYIASWMKLSMAMNPFGERSVLDEMLSRNAITVSPILIVLIEAMKSCFLESFCPRPPF
jgi:hypothetical protein